MQLYNRLIQKKKITFGDVTKENIKEHNPNWPEIHNHPYRMLIMWGSEFVKTFNKSVTRYW